MARAKQEIIAGLRREIAADPDRFDSIAGGEAEIATILSDDRYAIPLDGANVIPNWLLLINDYIHQTNRVFGTPLLPIDSSVKAVTSPPEESSRFGLASHGIFEAKVQQAQDYVQLIAEHNIAGDLIEFGIYKGDWVERLYQAMQKVGLQRAL